MAPPKAKGQKMGLGEFLTDTSLGSWADEMEDMPMPGSRPSYGGDSRQTSSWGGDRGDRGDRGGFGGDRGGFREDRGYPPRESLPLPTKPPFTVHLGNLTFDATDDDIKQLFSGCEISSVRLVEDKLDRKPKGFGYAEFATLDGLKKALEINGTQFQGRNIRVSVAEPQKERGDGRDFDWGAKRGPLPPAEPAREPGRGSYRGERPGFGPEGGDRPSRRPTFEQNDGKDRDFSNWERKGPLSPAITPGGPGGPRGPPGDLRERKNSPSWGEGRGPNSEAGSRPPRREFSDRPIPERTPTAAELDNKWRDKMRPDAPPVTSPTIGSKENSVPSSPSAKPATPVTSQAPTVRPKLNLQKRTVSTAEPSPALPTGASDAKSSPFGAARAVDTTQRDKEIEEKMKLRKEEEEKAREEKRVADEKAKEEKRLAKIAERKDNPRGKPNGQAKEGGDAQENASKNYQILKREAAEGEEDVNDHEPTGDAVSLEHDKNVKPQEIVKEANGATDTAQQLEEEEGWSTVSKPAKGRKAPRALAS